MIYYKTSECGSVRTKNEDSVICKFIGNTLCIILADGLGGCSAGEVASGIASEKLIESLKNNENAVSSFNEKELTVILNQSYQVANNAIAIEASKNKSDMSTTLTVVLVNDRKVLIGHIGDCRTYLLHGSKMEQLTKDHTVAAEQVSRGEISKEDLISHENRNVLTKYLGENCFVTPDIYRYNIMYGDLILVCTDGLYSHIGENELKELLRKHGSLEQCAKDLMDAVYANGANDNVSLVLAHNKPSK